ncbi:MAG: P-loop ATPase, Sll1717 family, partial [Vulcanimicrobiaceae bacterium]
GKDGAVFLDWTDPEAFKELAQRRMVASTGEDRPFFELWPMFFESHVDGVESFSYILSRTLMRPRDLIRFLRACVNAAVNRGHERVSEADIKFAEEEYSEDQLQDISFELRQVYPSYGELLYVFMGQNAVLGEDRVFDLLRDAGVEEKRLQEVIPVLVWFGILGVIGKDGEECYAYQFRYGLDRLKHEAATPRRFVVHPAFRPALGSAA